MRARLLSLLAAGTVLAPFVAPLPAQGFPKTPPAMSPALSTWKAWTGTWREWTVSLIHPLATTTACRKA